MAASEKGTKMSERERAGEWCRAEVKLWSEWWRGKETRKDRGRGKRGNSRTVSGWWINKAVRYSEGWRCRESEWTWMWRAFSIWHCFLMWPLFACVMPTPRSDPSCHSHPLEHDINGHAWYKQAHERTHCTQTQSEPLRRCMNRRACKFFKARAQTDSPIHAHALATRSINTCIMVVGDL